MAPRVGDVGPGVPIVVGWLLRALAPAGESRALIEDLEDEAADIAAASGRRAARRWIWWQALHSVRPLAAGRARQARIAMRDGAGTIAGGWGTDVKHVARRLRRSPGFTLVAVLTLALGIGANSAIFSLAYAIWLRPLPYAAPNELVRLSYVHARSGAVASMAGQDLADYRDGTQSFTGLAGYGYGAQIGVAGGEPVRVVAYHATTNLFGVLGVKAEIGRTFVPSDDGQLVVVLSHRTWDTRFGRDPAILSRTFTLTGRSYSIIGVMPARFSYLPSLDSDVWIPSSFADWTSRTDRYLQVVGRLRPGVSVEDASRDAGTVSARLAEAFSATNQGWSARVTPIDRRGSAGYGKAFGSLLGIVALFLFVGCANLAGLLVARNVERRGELAVCASLGAGRGRLARQAAVEALVLAAVGGVCGIALSLAASRVLAAAMPSGLPGLADVGVNVPVLAFSIAVCGLTAVISGLLPALGARSVSASEALTGARRIGPRSHRLQSALVVVEVAAAMTLVVGGTLMVRSFESLLDRDRGFNPHGVLALNVTLPFSAFDRNQDPDVRASALDRIIAAARRVTGVTSAGATNGFPGSSLGVLGGALLRSAGPAHEDVLAILHAASPDYFAAMGTRVLAGRSFSGGDTGSSTPVAIVNETLARALVPGGDAVGRQLALPTEGAGRSDLREIVGVVGDMRLDDRASPDVFLPVAQRPAFWVDLVVRTDGDPAALATPVRRALRSLEPDLLIENSTSIDAIISDSLGLQRAQSTLAAVVAFLAAVVSGVGLYALVAFVVAQRTREIGIRLALGSAPRALSWWLFRRGMRLAVIGIGIGIGATVLLVRYLGTLVFGLGTSTVSAYAASAGLLLVVALLAVWAPTRRVLRADPLVAMRSD
jgi:putative ABC transport system permease protein